VQIVDQAKEATFFMDAQRFLWGDKDGKMVVRNERGIVEQREDTIQNISE
jgi:hypothetical protein